MPSYRYTRDIKPEDLQPQQGPQLTGKEKRKNWWHYHWKIVAAIGLVVVLLVFFLAEVLKKDNPDLTVVMLTSKSLPDVVTDLLAEQLGTLVGDVNGDGKTMVEITVCNVTPYAEEDEQALEEALEQADIQDMSYEDPYAQMAGVTRLVAALDDDSAMIFLMETELLEAYQQTYAILGYLDGSPAGETATDYENMAYEWQDSPVLTALDFGIEYDGGVFDAGEYMSFFSIGVRQVADTRLADSEAAWENQAQALEWVNSWR